MSVRSATKTTGNVEMLNQLADLLDSGEYEQGSNRLRDVHDRFCCLGVACDVASKQKDAEVFWERLPNGPWSAVSGSPLDREVYVLPPPVQNLYGIGQFGEFDRLSLDFEEIQAKGHDTRRLETVVLERGEESLTALNDQGVTFPVIAEVIRQITRKGAWITT